MSKELKELERKFKKAGYPAAAIKDIKYGKDPWEKSPAKLTTIAEQVANLEEEISYWP